MNIVWKS